jgi:hypothetical protein
MSVGRFSARRLTDAWQWLDKVAVIWRTWPKPNKYVHSRAESGRTYPRTVFEGGEALIGVSPPKKIVGFWYFLVSVHTLRKAARAAQIREKKDNEN